VSVRTKVAFYDRPAFEYVSKYVTEDTLTYLDDCEAFALTRMYTMRGIIAPYKWTAIALHIDVASTHGCSDNSSVSECIDGAHDTTDEVEQSEDAVVAQLLYTRTHGQKGGVKSSLWHLPPDFSNTFEIFYGFVSILENFQLIICEKYQTFFCKFSCS